MQGVRLKPRVSVTALSLAVGGVTVLISVVTAATRFAPQVTLYAASAVPMLLVVGYLMVSRKPQAVSLEVADGSLLVDGYERRRVSLRPSEVALKRWVVPVLGTRQGDALVIRGAAAGGHEVVMSLGVMGGQSASAHDEPWEQVDISVGASEFSTLLTVLHVEPRTQVDGKDADATFVLVPHRGAGAAFAQMLPWLGTMALAGLIGVVGQPLLQTQVGTTLLFGATLALVVGGLVYTIRFASRPKREVTLRVSRSLVSVGEAHAPTFQVRPADLSHRFETYVYATKYGTYRFPVLVLGGDTKELRIGVWEDHGAVGLPAAPKGPAPHYLLSKAEFRLLLDRLIS